VIRGSSSQNYEQAQRIQQTPYLQTAHPVFTWITQYLQGLYDWWLRIEQRTVQVLDKNSRPWILRLRFKCWLNSHCSASQASARRQLKWYGASNTSSRSIRTIGAENSNQPTKLRVRLFRRFKSAGYAQPFLSTLGIVTSHFRVGRHLYRASAYRALMKSRFAVCEEAIGVKAIVNWLHDERRFVFSDSPFLFLLWQYQRPDCRRKTRPRSRSISVVLFCRQHRSSLPWDDLIEFDEREGHSA